MVMKHGDLVVFAFTSLVAQGETLFQRLSPMNGLRVTMGLIVVLVLGVVLLMVIKAGAHMARGFSAAAKRLPENSLPNEDDWADRPLNAAAGEDD